MSTPTLILPFEASAATVARRIARFSEPTTTSRVAPAAAATDPLIGVFGRIVEAIGDIADVIVDGVTLVELGATGQAGQKVTSDSVGRATPTLPAATTVQLIGVLLEPGVVGDHVRMLVNPQTIRTA